MRMRPSHAPMRDARTDGRLISHVFPDPSGGRDDQLGQIFRNMRVALKLTREGLARRLATHPHTIDDFEAGAVGSLPHWKETSRVVRGYCELLRLDPQPILWRLQGRIQGSPGHVAAPAPQPAARTMPPAAARPPYEPRTARTEPRERPARRRRRARALFALSAPVALVAAIVYLAQVAPWPVYKLVAFLPDQIEMPVRAGLDYLLLLTAPRRDGLRWIEVSDPQLRKADKLQTSTR